VILQHKSLAQGCAVLAAAALLATGCSSKSTPTAAATSTPPPSTSSSSSSAPAGGGPTDPNAAKTAVETTWTTYYDSTIDPSKKATLVQNAAKVAQMVTDLQSASQGAKSSANVTNVAFTDATHATVTFNILLNGQAVLSGVNGQAVLDPTTNQWQVSDVTLCALAQQASVPASVMSAAGCS
jgi:hypothetical protein